MGKAAAQIAQKERGGNVAHEGVVHFGGEEESRNPTYYLRKMTSSRGTSHRIEKKVGNLPPQERGRGVGRKGKLSTINPGGGGRGKRRKGDSCSFWEEKGIEPGGIFKKGSKKKGEMRIAQVAPGENKAYCVTERGGKRGRRIGALGQSGRKKRSTNKNRGEAGDSVNSGKEGSSVEASVPKRKGIIKAGGGDGKKGRKRSEILISEKGRSWKIQKKRGPG